MNRASSRWVRVIAAAVLLLAIAFLAITLPRGVNVPNLSETILTGGVVGAIVGFAGVIVAQYLAGKRHTEALLQARELEGERAQETAVLEVQRAQEAALQRYFEVVGNLLIEQQLHQAAPGDISSTVARAQTLSILAGLDDPARKRILLQFLYES